jgi:hypothetical protein
MRMPPYLISLRVTDQGRTKFRLWLPLFLLWLLLLPLFVLALVVTLLVDLFTLAIGWRFNATRFLFHVIGLLGETRGTEVKIDAHDKHNNGSDAQKRTSVAFTLR